MKEDVAELKLAAEPSAESTQHAGAHLQKEMTCSLQTAEEEQLRESASLNSHGLSGHLVFCSKALQQCNKCFPASVSHD